MRFPPRTLPINGVSPFVAASMSPRLTQPTKVKDKSKDKRGHTTLDRNNRKEDENPFTRAIDFVNEGKHKYAVSPTYLTNKWCVPVCRRKPIKLRNHVSLWEP